MIVQSSQMTNKEERHYYQTSLESYSANPTLQAVRDVQQRLSVYVADIEKNIVVPLKELRSVKNSKISQVLF